MLCPSPTLKDVPETIATHSASGIIDSYSPGLTECARKMRLKHSFSEQNIARAHIAQFVLWHPTREQAQRCNRAVHRAVHCMGEHSECTHKDATLAPTAPHRPALTHMSLTGNVEIALIKLSIAPLGHHWLVAAVHTGNVVALDLSNAVLCHKARERHREIIPQRQEFT